MIWYVYAHIHTVHTQGTIYFLAGLAWIQAKHSTTVQFSPPTPASASPESCPPLVSALHLFCHVLQGKEVKYVSCAYSAACYNLTILNTWILFKLTCFCQRKRERNKKFWILQGIFLSARCIDIYWSFPAPKRPLGHFFLIIYWFLIRDHWHS